MPRDLLPDIPNKQGNPVDLLPDIPNQSNPGLLEYLGFGNGQFKSPLQALRETAEMPSLEQIANSPGINALKGAQDVMQRNLSFGLVNPNPRGEGFAYDVGRGIGDIGSYALGGSLGKLGAGALGSSAFLAEKAPAIADIFKSFANSKSIPGKIGQTISSGFNPTSTAEDFLNFLGKGDDLGQNSKEIAKQLNNKFNEVKQIGSEKYNSVLGDTNGIGSESLSGLTQNQTILPKSIIKSFDVDLKDLHNDFIKNPTVNNAHTLSKQLGSSIRALRKQESKGNLTQADRKDLQNYIKAKKTIDSKIYENLDQASQEKGIPYSNMFDQANQFWRENVVPYTENPNIAEIASGKIKNPDNVKNIFASPEENIFKVAEDLGPEFKHRLLYAQLGKHKNNLTNEKILGALDKLEEQGLSDYITDAVKNYRHQIRQQKTKSDFIRTIGGALGGGLAGSLIPGGKEIGMITGGLIGSPLRNLVINALRAKKGIE